MRLNPASCRLRVTVTWLRVIREFIARALGLSAEETADLVYAARVHDVGKIFIPERILNKPGPLNDDEFYQVKLHAQVGAEIVGTIPHTDMMREAIEHHHQRFDGSGYPGGLRGEQIPLWARIIGLADAYANMVTEQSYSTGRTPDQALEELSGMSGTRFDGMLVRLLHARAENGADVFFQFHLRNVTLFRFLPSFIAFLSNDSRFGSRRG